mgnify:CR=1 FL=1
MTTGGGGDTDQIPFIGFEGVPGVSDNGFNTIYLALMTGASNTALDFSTSVFQAVEDADELLTIKVDNELLGSCIHKSSPTLSEITLKTDGLNLSLFEIIKGTPER